MDVLFFFLLITSFSCGVIILFLLLSRARQSGDPGTVFFLAPLFPLTLITMLETVNYYLRTRFPLKPFLTIEMIDDFFLICVAFGWNYLTLKHYDLNNLSSFTKSKKYLLYTAALILTAAVPVFYIYKYQWKNLINFVTIAFLFFAGARAVNFHLKAVNPLPSSKAAVKIAYISLIIYPVIFIGNILNWSLPFLDNNISFWVQVHPLYIIFVNVPVLMFLINNKSIQEIIHTLPDGDSVIDSLMNDLTGREKEIFLLLYHGKRYREIADTLFISVSTVKTHINHIYKKLDITRREELYRKFQADFLN